MVTVQNPTPHTISMPATKFCSNNPVAIAMTGSPAGGTFSGRGVVGNTFNPQVAGLGTHVITYSSNGTNGFCGSTTQTIEVFLPTLDLGPELVICPGSTTPVQLTANLAGGVWTGLHVTPNGVFTPPVGLKGSVVLTYSITAPVSYTHLTLPTILLV